MHLGKCHSCLSWGAWMRDAYAVEGNFWCMKSLAEALVPQILHSRSAVLEVPDLACKSQNPLCISPTQSIPLTINLSLSALMPFPAAGRGNVADRPTGGVITGLPALHHVPRTGEGSSEVFLCAAHLMEESDDILLLHSKHSKSPSWGFVGIVMRYIEEWCRVEIPSGFSCFKLSIYTWYFKAIFRKTPYLDCGDNKSTLETFSYNGCELKVHSVLLYPSEHFPWPVTCCSPRLKFILVQPKAKKKKRDLLLIL